MTSLLRFLFFLFMSMVFSSCAHFPKPSFIANRDTHYLTAKSIPPLRIPPGLSSNAFQNYYPIPDRDYPEYAKNVNLLPPGLV